MSTALTTGTGSLTLDVLSPAGETTGTVDLPPEIFDVQVNIPLIHQVVVAQLAAARQGTHDTKNRGEVRGGGRKPYRQKGTGRARQGSTRAPHFSGGGVVHGPTPRDYAQRTPKKMKAAALRGALSDRVRSGRVHVVSAVVDGDAPSTRSAATLLARITDRRNVLVVINRDDVISSRSIRNVQGVHLLHADQLNTYDVLVSDDVVFVEAALTSYIEGALARASRAAGTAYTQDVLVDGLQIDVDGDGDTDLEVVFDEPVAIGPDDELVVELTDDTATTESDISEPDQGESDEVLR